VILGWGVGGYLAAFPFVDNGVLPLDSSFVVLDFLIRRIRFFAIKGYWEWGSRY